MRGYSNALRPSLLQAESVVDGLGTRRVVEDAPHLGTCGEPGKPVINADILCAAGRPPARP